MIDKVPRGRERWGIFRVNQASFPSSGGELNAKRRRLFTQAQEACTVVHHKILITTEKKTQEKDEFQNFFISPCIARFCVHKRDIDCVTTQI